MSLTIKYQWTADLRIFLIRCVEKRMRLWKKHQAGAHDGEIRSVLWNMIRQEIIDQYDLDIETSELKKTWKNLKDNYIRISKTAITDTSRALKWMYFEHLQFLEDQDNVWVGKVFPGEEHVDIKNLIHEMRLDALTKQYERLPPLPPQPSSSSYQTQLPDVEKVQIGFYELDALIKTKQRRPHNLQMLHIEQYIGPVEFIRVPRNESHRNNSYPIKRVRDHPESNENAASPDSSGQQAKKQKLDATSIVSKVKAENGIENPERCFECPKIHVDYIKGMLDEKTKAKIIENCHIIRDAFVYVAIQFVHKERLVEGSIDYIIDDFDDYVYRNMPLPNSVTIILQLLTGSERSEYLKFFDMLDKRRKELSDLKVPHRQCVDIHIRKEMTHFFENYGITTTPQLDQSNLDLDYRKSVKVLVRKKQIQQGEIKVARNELEIIRQQLDIFENHKRQQVEQEIVLREADIEEKEKKLRQYQAQHAKLIEEYARIDDQRHRSSLIVKAAAIDSDETAAQV